MFHQSPDFTTLHSPKALQHPPVDVLLNKYIDDSYTKLHEIERERQLKLRAPFIKLFKQKVPAGKSVKANASVLANLRNSDLFKDSFNDDDWASFIAQFNKIEIKDFKKNTTDLPIYLFLRNELELAFYQKPVITNTLDSVIDLIAKNGITDKACKALLLHLRTLHYIEDDANLSIEDLTNLTPAINALLIKGLFNKVNFIRLVLQQNTKDKTGHYYLRSTIDSETTAEFITTLLEHEMLNQNNLELLFKLFIMHSNEQVNIDIKLYLNSLKEYLTRIENDDYNLYNLLVDTIPNLDIAFTESEILRIGLDEEQTEAQLNQAVALQYKELLSQLATDPEARRYQEIMTELPDETDTKDEEKPYSLLVEFANAAKLKENEVKDLAMAASAFTPELASMLIMLHRDHLVKVDNFIVLLSLAENLEIIEVCYSWLSYYRVFEVPQEILSRLISIPGYDLHSAYQLVAWLPEKFRDPENCYQIFENARYAKNILQACQYECLIDGTDKSDEQMLSIFENNILHKDTLATLVSIYEKIGEDNFPAFKDQLQMLAVNKIYVPSVLAEIIQAELTIRDVNPIAMEATLQVAVEKHNSWKTSLTYINNCELIFNNPNNRGGYRHTGNAAYFFNRSEDNSSLISVAYSNKILKCFEELKLTDDELTTLNSEFTGPEEVLSEDQLALLAQHSKHTHEILPEPIILRLQNFPDSIEFEHLVSLIECYKIMLASESLDQVAPFVESQQEHLLELTNALVFLFTCKLFAARYISLLQIRPDLSSIVAEMIYRMGACGQLTDINYLRFSTELMTNPDFVRQYHHEMSDAELLNFIFYDAHEKPKSLMVADNDDEAWDDDPDGSIATTNFAEFETSREALSTQLKAFAGFTGDEVIGDDKALREEKYTSHDTVTPPPEPTVKVDFNALVDRCRKDKNSGFCPWLFTRSPFLELVDNHKITTIEQVEAYAKEKPTSRTSRIYLQMKVEIMQDNSPAKKFLQTYFKEYRFSYFQRSQLVPKLLDNCTMDTIQNHADSNRNNRSNAILTRRLR